MARPGPRARNRAEQVAQEAATAAQAWLNKNAADGGVCDFCAHLIGDGPYFTWVAEPIIGGAKVVDLPPGMPSSEAFIGFQDDALWAACPKCDPVVAAGDVPGLVEHVVRNCDIVRVGGVPDRADLAALYTAFYAGGPRRLS